MKNMLTPADFAGCPAWLYNQDDEGYYEVPNFEALQKLEDQGIAQSSANLCLLAEFTTPTGHKLAGELVGVQDIFAIGLFVNNESILINRNMHSRSREQVARFLFLSGLANQLNFETLFPLRYESHWGDGTFIDFSGVFERPD